MEGEFRQLLDSRKQELKKACSLRGFAERKDALCSLAREVLGVSSLAYVGGKLSRYDGRGYMNVGVADVRDALVNVLSDMGVGASDISKLGDTPYSVLKRKTLDVRRDVVAFGNCIFSLVDGCTYGFDKATASWLCLDYPFNDNGCPQWSAFLEEVLPGADERAVLQEFFGMCLVDRNYLSIEKMALFVGSGANGKSVVCDVMRSVFGGGRYVGNLSPDQLQDAKQITSLENAVLNIAPDVRKGSSFDSALKALASSQEITGWKLYEGGVVIKCPPLCFALNEMPYFRDTTDAFFRRLLVFRFDVVIPEDRQDRTLATRIVANESCGVFRWAYEGYQRLLRNKGMFSHCERMKDALSALKVDVKTSQSEVLQCVEAMGYALSGEKVVKVDADEIVADMQGKVTKYQVTRELKKAGIECQRTAKGMYYKLYKI